MGKDQLCLVSVSELNKRQRLTGYRNHFHRAPPCQLRTFASLALVNPCSGSCSLFPGRRQATLPSPVQCSGLLGAVALGQVPNSESQATDLDLTLEAPKIRSNRHTDKPSRDQENKKPNPVQSYMHVAHHSTATALLLVPNITLSNPLLSLILPSYLPT